jgi:hypothetical protein
MIPMSARTERRRRLPLALKLLLSCGIAAALVYVATDLAAAAVYPGYSLSHQAVSELFALGAPTSNLVGPLFSLSSAFLFTFALGIAFSQQSRMLRLMALMFSGSGVVGLALWNFFPMHMRGEARTFTDTMHLILSSNPFVWATLVIGAVAFRNWFRWASIGTIIVVVAPGIFAFHYAAALHLGRPTPGLGLTERTAQYVYQAWQIALALLLIRGSGARQAMSAIN